MFKKENMCLKSKKKQMVNVNFWTRFKNVTTDISFKETSASLLFNARLYLGIFTCLQNIKTI